MLGIRAYICFVLYAFVVGLALYSVRNVFRDMYYVLPTLIWIFIGYHLAMKRGDRKSDLLKTLYLYGGIVSIKCIITFVLNPVFEFSYFKSVFVLGVYDIGFILPILVMEVVVLRKKIFSRFMDSFLIFVMMLQIVLSFGRIAILEPIIVICVMVILLAIFRPEKELLLLDYWACSWVYCF